MKDVLIRVTYILYSKRHMKISKVALDNLLKLYLVLKMKETTCVEQNRWIQTEFHGDLKNNRMEAMKTLEDTNEKENDENHIYS
jgi:hypothetical protein